MSDRTRNIAKKIFNEILSEYAEYFKCLGITEDSSLTELCESLILIDRAIDLPGNEIDTLYKVVEYSPVEIGDIPSKVGLTSLIDGNYLYLKRTITSNVEGYAPTEKGRTLYKLHQIALAESKRIADAYALRPEPEDTGLVIRVFDVGGVRYCHHIFTQDDDRVELRKRGESVPILIYTASNEVIKPDGTQYGRISSVFGQWCFTPASDSWANRFLTSDHGVESNLDVEVVISKDYIASQAEAQA